MTARNSSHLWITLIPLVVASSSIAQSYGHLSINEVSARFDSHGMIGLDTTTGDPDFFVPAGSNVSPFYAGSVWIGGLDSAGAIHLAALRFDQELPPDYSPGPLTTDGTASIDSATSTLYDHVWSITAGEVAEHQAYFNCLQTPGCDVAVQFPGYVMPANITTWPGNGNVLAGQAPVLAPFIDADGDGVYEPSNGDAPCIQGDQALYFIFNDKLTQHSSGGQPIGVEVHAMPFAFDSSDPALTHTIFIKYRIVNRSSSTLFNAHIGLFTDFDLGNQVDDHIGCDPYRRLWYVYNGDSLDETTASRNGYGLQPPAFGGMLLQGPHMDPNGIDDSDLPALPSWNGQGFGDQVIDNERLGLTRVRYFSNTSSVSGDPSTASQYWGYLTDRWRDSTLMYYGGTGYGTWGSSVPARYAFPDDTDPLGVGTGGIILGPWSEMTAINSPGDRRAVGSTGPITFLPGQEVEVLYALTYARASSGGPFASVTALQQRTDSIRTFFDAMQMGCSGQGSQLSVPDLKLGDVRLGPNPCNTVLNISMKSPNSSTVSVLDGTGRTVLPPRSVSMHGEVDVRSLAAGPYWLIIEMEGNRQSLPFIKEH